MLTFTKPKDFKPAKTVEITEDEFKACQDFVQGVLPERFNLNVPPCSDEFCKPWREAAVKKQEDL